MDRATPGPGAPAQTTNGLRDGIATVAIEQAYVPQGDG